MKRRIHWMVLFAAFQVGGCQYVATGVNAGGSFLGRSGALGGSFGNTAGSGGTGAGRGGNNAANGGFGGPAVPGFGIPLAQRPFGISPAAYFAGPP